MKPLAWVRKNGLGVVICLIAATGGLSVYAIAQIQSQRTSLILRTCNEQNSRHANTDHEIDKILKGRERIVPRLLVNQLAPYQNCQKVLTKATKAP